MDNEIGLLMLEQLKALRGEMQGMRAEQRDTNERLGRVEAEQHATNERLDSTNERLGRVEERMERLEKRQVESEVRLGTAIAELQRATEQNTTAIRALADETKTLYGRIDHVLLGPMGDSVRDHEQRLRTIEARLVG